MRAALTALVVACLVVASGQGLCAQEKPKDHAKFQDRIEWMTMWKLMEALSLDRETADKVYEIRREFLGQKRTLVKEINAEIETLKQELEADADNISDAQLAEKIKSIREKRKKLEGLLDEQFGKLSEVLSIRQQAKLVVFMKDFREELRAMFRGPGPRGPHPPPPRMGFPPPPGPPPPLDSEAGPGGPLGGPPGE